MTPQTTTVLVLYHAARAPLRTAIADHLYAVDRFGRCRTLYINVAVRSIPSWVTRLGVDLIVFHTTLLAQRWQPAVFRGVLSKLRRLKNAQATKVAIPQDEFLRTDQLSEFLREFRVDHVLTCAPQSEWHTIYGALADGPTTFHQVMTGYLHPGSVNRIATLAQSAGARKVDVAYRAWQPEAWLGRHAQLKGTIAEAFERVAPAHGLSTDISLRDRDTLLGYAWFKFLLEARWTIGVEGGASIIDHDGTLRDRTLAYVREHPEASFAEVEAACFPGQEGSLNLMTISPRHLEACATRTAQALVEGEYNGILKPGIHYLPVKGDLSNLGEVCLAMRDEQLRDALAERAYADVVASRRFEYQGFADLIVSMAGRRSAARRSVLGSVLFAWESRLDRVSWLWVDIRQNLRGAIRNVLDAVGLLPRIQRIRGMNVETRG